MNASNVLFRADLRSWRDEDVLAGCPLPEKNEVMDWRKGIVGRVEPGARVKTRVEACAPSLSVSDNRPDVDERKWSLSLW